MLTPKADKILQIYRFETKEGLLLNDVIMPGQREIMEVILGRGITGQDGRRYDRIHVMAHTRYGKSLAVGAAVAVRASVNREKWAIIAPTKDQAQIIMDYVLHFATNDPIMSSLLSVDAKQITNERLTQRRSRGHITFKQGGEVRVFPAGQTMGFGAENIIEDEAGLINNHDDSRIFRMLGDSTDNFLVKIGNPWDSLDQTAGAEHHFYSSYKSPEYYQIDIPISRGIAEGRVTEKFHEEVKSKPNYSVLYQNTFPRTERRDAKGYLPLLSHVTLKNAIVQPGDMEILGEIKLGGDPADGGQNESVIAYRGMNLARIVLKTTEVDCLQFADEVMTYGADIDEWFVDKQGVGSGTVRKLQEQAQAFRKLTPINAGDTKEYVERLQNGKDAEQYMNLRAYMFWQLKLWVEGGGKIEWCEGIEKQLMAVRYKSAGKGKVKIISKDELRKRGIDDLGLADAISFTFAPFKKKVVMGQTKVTGGVKPFYPKLGV